jgi:hypothetical protein
MYFKFGNKKSLTKVVVTSLLFSGIIATLSQCSGIDEKKLTEVVDAINREWVKNKDINEQIITNPELLNDRIDRDVDNAIEQYMKEEPQKSRMTDNEILNESKKYDTIQQQVIQEGIYYELPKDGSRAQDLLGPPMGIRLDAN